MIMVDTNMPDTKKFWLIWRQCGIAPTKRHPSLESAQSEADRLAQKYPGEPIYVLECIEAKYAPVPAAITIEMTAEGGF